MDYVLDFQTVRRYVKFLVIFMVGYIVGSFFFKQGNNVFISKALAPKISQDWKKVASLKNFAPVVVIGGGAAGYSSSIFLAQSGYLPQIFSGPTPGGALLQTQNINNWIGILKTSGPEFIKILQTQAKEENVITLQKEVLEVNFSQWPFKLRIRDISTQVEEDFFTLSCIICTGAKPSKLNVPGESEFWGRGVTNCAICDSFMVKNKHAVVVGGGDAAMTEALQLSATAESITVLVRKSNLKAKASLIETVKNIGNINILFNVEVKEIVGDSTGIKKVKVYNTESQTESEINTAGVFLAVGSVPNTAIFKNKINLSDAGYIKVNPQNQETSAKGIFAAGDVTGSVAQAIVAAGDGCIAALAGSINFLNSLGIYPKNLNDAMNVQTTKKDSEEEAPVMSENDSVVNNDDFSENMSYNDANIKNKYKSMIEVDSTETITEVLKVAALDKKNKKIVLLDFYATWCGPCKNVTKALESIIKDPEFTDHVMCGKINVDVTPELASVYKIMAVPTIVFFDKNQNQVKTLTGASEASIKETLRSLI